MGQKESKTIHWHSESVEVIVFAIARDFCEFSCKLILILFNITKLRCDIFPVISYSPFYVGNGLCCHEFA